MQHSGGHQFFRLGVCWTSAGWLCHMVTWWENRDHLLDDWRSKGVAVVRQHKWDGLWCLWVTIRKQSVSITTERQWVYELCPCPICECIRRTKSYCNPWAQYTCSKYQWPWWRSQRGCVCLPLWCPALHLSLSLPHASYVYPLMTKWK